MIKAYPLAVELNTIKIADGTLEILKWLALVLMTLDHANKYIYNLTLPGLTEAGRVAMPLFSFIFAYNLSRRDTLIKGVYQRVLTRLLLIGLISCIPYIALGSVKYGWYPLNILFTLLASGLAIYVYDRGEKWHKLITLLIILLCGSVVEYSWSAIIMTFAAWHYCKQATYLSLSVWILATVSLYFINGNLWALLALALIFVASQINLRFPRWRNVFYIYYPGHLTIILLMLM